MGALAQQLGYANGTDTGISSEDIHNLTDAQLSHRLLPLGIKLAENCTTEEEAIEGMLLAEAGARLAGSAYTNVTGDVVEPDFTPLNEIAKATFLHVLDRFISEDCKVPEGCSHFDEVGAVPNEEQVLELIGAIENSSGVALYSTPVTQETQVQNQNHPAFTDDASSVLAGLSDPHTAADAIKAAYDDPTTVGAIVNAKTGEVTALRPGPETSLLLMELAYGGPITQEYLNQTTEEFRQSLVASGVNPIKAQQDAELINREISALL